MKTTLYETITRQIVDAIEEGAGTYHMPWHRSGQDIAAPRNALTHRTYRGLNVITLWMVAEAKGYASGTWATYQQWLESGAQVKKGEKATTVFFWKRLGSEADTGSPSDAAGNRAQFVARAFSVFNADQVEGYERPSVPLLSEAERIAAAEASFAAVPARIIHGGNSACYVPAADEVRMVPFSQFGSATGYYAVLAHELTHWSGVKDRLARDLSVRFGSEGYAMEELVAELGAAFITGHLALPSVPRTDHAPYIASWLKVLKSDSRAIFAAAGKAQAAADYLAGFSTPPDQALTV